MGDGRAARLLRNAEGVAYWGAVAPVLARMPAALGYRIACWRGDRLYRSHASKRANTERHLRLFLGGELGRVAARQVRVQESGPFGRYSVVSGTAGCGPYGGRRNDPGTVRA